MSDNILNHSFNNQENGSASACKTLLDISFSYLQKIEKEDVSRDIVVLMAKEFQDLLDNVYNSKGTLEFCQKGQLSEEVEKWRTIRSGNGITDYEVAQAELPHKTATGRATATPHFPSRFDM